MPSADALCSIRLHHCSRSCNAAEHKVSWGKTRLLHKVMSNLQLCTSEWTRVILSSARLPSHNCLIHFLYVITLLGHQLPSDSSLPTTPLPRLVDRFISAHSGLSPPRYASCPAHTTEDRLEMICRKHPLSIRSQCQLLSLPCSTVYYKPLPRQARKIY